ncbi:MAG: 50S ribosomal protein L29 [Desulfovibrionaceae bacterium]
MQIKEIKEMDEGKLREALAEQRKALFDSRFQHATAQLENTKAIPETKKTIARILTVMRERDMGA